MTNLPFPSYETFADSKRFFVDVAGPTGESEKAMISLRKACVVVSVPCLNGSVSKVAFMKTSRSKNFRDSREPKKYVTGAEVKAELRRLLRDDHAAEEAWRALQV